MSSSWNRTIGTPRLSLRPLGVADAGAAHRLWTDPDVRRHLWDGRIIPRERGVEVLAASERDFAERGFGLWGVHERGAEPPISMRFEHRETLHGLGTAFYSLARCDFVAGGSAPAGG